MEDYLFFRGGWKEMYTLHADVDFVLSFLFDIGAKGFPDGVHR